MPSPCNVGIHYTLSRAFWAGAAWYGLAEVIQATGTARSQGAQRASWTTVLLFASKLLVVSAV